MKRSVQQGTVRRAACALLVGLMVLASPGAAFAVAPVTSLITDPPAPAVSGWYTAPPLVSLASDQDGIVAWSFDGGAEQTAAVSAGVARYITTLPDGVSILRAHSTNLLAEVESPGLLVALQVDSIAPSQPTGFNAIVTRDVGVTLSWSASTDSGSGLRHYAVYRKAGLPPFTPADVIGTTTSLTYFDAPPPFSGMYSYAVSAFDLAGNESPLSELTFAISDFTAPTTPAPMEAWLNDSGNALVRWTASVDNGSGIHHYQILRSIDGGAFVSVGVAGPNDLLWVDTDPAVGTATTVDYEVVAWDRIGYSSPPAGPARMGMDSARPVLPAGFAAAPIYAPPGSGSFFQVTWPTPTDSGSGILRVELLYGPDPAAPVVLDVTGRTTATVGVTDDSALFHFLLRVEDHAGNVTTSPVVSARHVTVDRIAGADRMAVAVATSRTTFAGASTVVVASAYNYTDALAASALAGDFDAPILLVGNTGVRADVAAEIRRLGATRAYIVGGPASVSAVTKRSLDGIIGGVSTRLWGLDRYTTAAAVARDIRSRHPGGLPRVYLVSGRNFPDALSAAPAAFARHAPVLYANTWSVPAATLSAIRAVGATSTIIVGGTGSVTASAERLVPGPVRIGGADRYVVSRAFAEWAIADGVLSDAAPVVASGLVFPDGLTAAPLAGMRGSVTVLTSPYSAGAAVTAAWFGARRAHLSKVTLTGGTGTLPETVRLAIRSAVCQP